MTQKTVYILGAGFSMEFGAPSQSNLLKAIFNLRQHPIYGNKKQIEEWLYELNTFLLKGLHVTDEQIVHYSLEDIYTPIDKSILEFISFRNYTPIQLLQLRDKINRLVILAIRSEIETNKDKKKGIDKFARLLVEKCKVRIENEKEDLVSVITTNWDIILDNKIFNVINEDEIPKGHKFSGVLDYCCYISSLTEKDEKIKPGLYALGKGRYNVKLLKLHGSLNWLQCPKCSRLFVKLYQDFNGGYVIAKKYCRHCNKNFPDVNKDTNCLYTNLITPTFLKNLNNVQNKLVWQNAAIELSEASKIIFLGYSLPHADFEFKQLLSRMIRTNADIEVVLIKDDNPENYHDKQKYNAAGYRFENFFSGRNLKISYEGVANYLEKL
ncbi:MAG: hypothetical protein IPO63_02475 [Bacteroidetes bacterium]|nr:hypothetical protein [Bacteroidota bacterium]